MEEKQGSAPMGAGVKLMLAMGALLLVATVVIGFINIRQMKKEQTYSASTRITVLQNGTQLAVLEGGDVVRIRPEEFQLEEGGPVYTGVALSAVLDEQKFLIDGVKQVTIQGVGGSFSSLSMEELLEPTHAYLVYGRDGDPLELPEKGGDGPFLLILRGDQDRSRWVNGVNLIELS